jgi:hypothetical protein
MHVCVRALWLWVHVYVLLCGRVCLLTSVLECVRVVLCTLAVAAQLHSVLRLSQRHVHASTYTHTHCRTHADVLENPRYMMAFSDREYIRADSSSDDNLSDGSFGNDIDDDQGSATSVASDQSLSR